MIGNSGANEGGADGGDDNYREQQDAEMRALKARETEAIRRQKVAAQKLDDFAREKKRREEERSKRN